jgi:hypothetical protein
MPNSITEMPNLLGRDREPMPNLLGIVTTVITDVFKSIDKGNLLEEYLVFTLN